MSAPDRANDPARRFQPDFGGDLPRGGMPRTVSGWDDRAKVISAARGGSIQPTERPSLKKRVGMAVAGAIHKMDKKVDAVYGTNLAKDSASWKSTIRNSTYTK